MKKKVLSLALALALCVALAAPVLAENTATVRNGETAILDVDKYYPGECVVNVTSEGDLRLDVKTDGDIYLALMNSEGRCVAAREQGSVHWGNIGKSNRYNGYYYATGSASRPTDVYFTFHVKPGVYRIPITTEDGLCFVELTATVLTATATPNYSKVLVDGREAAFDAYTINENNYFRLRDLASVLSGTDKRFDVSWDDTRKAIDLLSGQRYTSVGGELDSGDGKNKNAELNTAPIYLDGEKLQMAAYTINQNNYFKLRDIGQTFGFSVTWDGAQNAILIDTTQGYTAD